MKISCIYIIRNIVNDKIYIGSATNYMNRKRQHMHGLRNNKHKNIKLQNAYNKYGESNIVFEIYQKVDNVNDLINFEQKAIDLLNPFYNINKIANSSLGIKRSDETKNKISISLKGKEGRNKGYKYSDEYKKRMSDIRKGVPVPKRKGIKLTEEHKQKLSLSKLGKKKEKGILYGENAVRSKLSTEQVIEIRRKYNEDNISTVKLGKEYCVSSHSISCIINYKTWKHI